MAQRDQTLSIFELHPYVRLVAYRNSTLKVVGNFRTLYDAARLPRKQGRPTSVRTCWEQLVVHVDADRGKGYTGTSDIDEATHGDVVSINFQRAGGQQLGSTSFGYATE